MIMATRQVWKERSDILSERLLFQKLPVALFVPLAAPLAELYATVLLRIFEETQRHQEPLSWEYCVAQIVEAIVETEGTRQC